MQALIKQIRGQLGMSQADLAERLNVSFATVNRWENGRAVPNRLAQSKLYEICKERSVPVYDMLISRIESAADRIILPESRVLLYHGSKLGIEGRIEPKSRSQCDFGKGFYMGTVASQALTLICDYDRSRFYIVSVDMADLSVIDIQPNIEWAMLVAYHRGKMERIAGTSLYAKYRDMTAGKDMVVGSIANDRMFYVIDNFFIGNITDVALVKSLSALQLGQQYVTITQKGCDAVRIEEEIELSHLERLCIKDVAEENRAKGVSLAKDICKNYRREGLFFDEILDQSGNGAI